MLFFMITKSQLPGILTIENSRKIQIHQSFVYQRGDSLQLLYRYDNLSPPPLRSKPRQLTPIRYRKFNFIQSLSPSPTTSTDLDLSIELANLPISESLFTDQTIVSQPPHLLPLLKECGQSEPHEFSAFIETILEVCIRDKLL